MKENTLRKYLIAVSGTGALIIAPTRELALQIYGVLKELCSSGLAARLVCCPKGDSGLTGFLLFFRHKLTYGLVIGGVNRKMEADRLSKGVNVLVATPGRILDHLMVRSSFVLAATRFLFPPLM